MQVTNNDIKIRFNTALATQINVNTIQAKAAPTYSHRLELRSKCRIRFFLLRSECNLYLDELGKYKYHTIHAFTLRD